jgi:transcriptional regulator with GAF, ATPase, and Fis domain
LEDLVGDSPALREVLRLIERVGPTDKPVLIQGETGVGKELVARAVQRHSPRVDRPFLVINCAALPEPLIESELFGHDKGAFTGAGDARPGLFEVADGGTLFVDEIGELPNGLQPKLLRVLEDGSLRRVGSARERRVDVRIIAATNRSLDVEVRERRFRDDLWYRINVFPITVPPLRDRPDDIPRLIRHFLPAGWTIAPDAEVALQQFPWPGNVRQLRNVLDRATILADDLTVTLDDLPSELATEAFASHPDPDDRTLQGMERTHVLRILDGCGGNKSQAARALGIHRRKLYRLLERLGLDDR